MWKQELLNTIIDLSKIFIPAPFFGYIIFLLAEANIKAWKLRLKWKKWLLGSAIWMLVIVYTKYLIYLLE